jgi:soluble lytic murein transglycosylase
VSPSTVTASTRSRSSKTSVGRRRAAVRRRRRRIALGVALIAAVGVGAVLLMPLAQRAVNDLGLPLDYPGLIRQEAAQKHLDPALVAAVIYAETKFDPRTSSAGAEGLMQLMPQTAQFLAKRSGATTFTNADLSTPAVNIAYGSYYLRYLLNEFHGNLVAALAAYNGGDGNVQSWIAEARADGHRLRIGDIPFPETRAYVQRVLQAQTEYRHRYAAALGYR